MDPAIVHPLHDLPVVSPRDPDGARRAVSADHGGRDRAAATSAGPALTVFDRLDPDALYPARLAGAHAWVAWGLADHADPCHLELAVPARYPDSYVDGALQRIATRLARPIWPDPEPRPIDVHGRTLRVLDDHGPVTVEILDLPWYQPASDRRLAGDAVTSDRWPVIDEIAAVRQRLETIAARGVSDRDVADISRWIHVTAGRNAISSAAPTNLSAVLAHLDREAPAATAGINMVIGQARGTHARDGEAASMRDDAYQRLSDELARVAASRRGSCDLPQVAR